LGERVPLAILILELEVRRSGTVLGPISGDRQGREQESKQGQCFQ
jgi:hypothetical protein